MFQVLQHYELAIVIPLLGALFILVFHKYEQLREASSILAGLCLFLYVYQLFNSYESGAPTHILLNISAGFSIAFHLEPLGLVFALVASSLWIITTIY